nr:PREDICTED: cytokinin riboside 5'-monophosphate phosphoribohydrolase LOG5-like isoform X2 [Fragaria vesca subsp. vesca]
MGSVSKAVHDGGGHVFGIIPRDLLPVEITGETYGEEIRVTDMHERKAKMAREADCFIALPGGFGTLEELLEVVSWYKLGIHDKPVGVLNVDGFFNLFLSSIDNSVDEGFIHPSHHHIIVVASNAKELLDKLEEYEPVPEQQEQQEIHVGFNVAPAPPVAATLETDGGEEARSG